MNISKEDYIKVIYELGGYKYTVNNKAIAESLKVSAPSVSEMIKKLVKDDLITYIEYKGVRLTDLGKEEARKVRKRHLLWEVFLVEKLGYTWDEVDEEAENLEHVTSEKLEERLDKYLGYPKTCPHGSPIVLEYEDLTYKSLGELDKGDLVRVVRVMDSPDLLQFIDSKEIGVGSRIRIDDKAGKDVIIKKEDSSLVEVGEEYSDKIFVE